MTTAIIILTVVAVICAGLFIVMRIVNGGIVSFLTKTLASLAFVALGTVVTFTHPQDNLGMYLILGLVCGLIGDMLLDLKCNDMVLTDTYLNFGFLSFSIEHVFYIVFLLLMSKGIDTTWMLVGSGAFAILFALAVVFLAKKLLGLELGKFKLQAGGYALLLSFTAAFSVALCFANPQMILFAVGAVAFWVSDIVLSQMYFGGKMDSAFHSATNHVLYYGAQILIALSLVMM